MKETTFCVCSVFLVFYLFIFCDDFIGVFTKWHFSRLRLFGAEVTHDEVECDEFKMCQS